MHLYLVSQAISLEKIKKHAFLRSMPCTLEAPSLQGKKYRLLEGAKLNIKLGKGFVA